MRFYDLSWLTVNCRFLTWSCWLFSSKSFKVGEANDAYALNVPVGDIQALGWWGPYVLRSGGWREQIASRVSVAGAGPS